MIPQIRYIALAGIALFLLNTLNAQVLLDEDFTGGTSSDLTVNQVFGATSWSFNNPGGRTITGAGFDSDFAIFDSDAGGQEAGQSMAELVSVPFDASSGNIYLDLDYQYRSYQVSSATVEVWNGTAWSTVYNWSSFDDGYPVAQHLGMDITGPAGGSNQAKVKVVYYGVWDWWLAVDNIKISATECKPPLVNFLQSGPYAVRFNMHNGSTDAGSYNWEVRNDGGSPGSPGAVASGTTPPDAEGIFTTVMGLGPNTTYTLYVRSDCGNSGFVYWSQAGVFTTSGSTCGPAEIPYTEDFNAVVPPALPLCMQAETISGNPWQTTDDQTGQFSNSAWVQYTPAGSPNMDSWMYTQGLDLTGGNTYRLTYSYRTSLTFYMESMRVKLGADASELFMATSLADHPTINDGVEHRDTIDFIPATTGVYFIGFQCYSAADQYYLYVDDISVTTGPPCQAPSGLTVDETYYNDVEFHWNNSTSDPAQGYEWEIRTSGTGGSGSSGLENDGNTEAGDTDAFAEGLDPGTNYTLWLRSHCGPGNYSDWISVPAATPSEYDCEGVYHGTATVGSPCDDGDASTGNDVYNANCTCVGQVIDCEGVPGGNATVGTACDDNDPGTGNDVYNANCNCVGQVIDCEGVPGGNATIGTACDDNDPGTGNDVYNANCNCVGQVIDCEGVPGGNATVGTACDDNDPGTGNDVYNANCTCVGQVIDCEGVPGGNATVGTACDDNDPGTGNDVYNANCNCVGQSIDCEGVPGGNATVGTACDDNDPGTGNDVYNANCNCVGQSIDCEGVPGGNATVGTACDDNNPATGNDVYNANCNCVGQVIDCEGVPGGNATIGTACDDNDPGTGNDVYNADCNCVGQVIDCEGVPGGSATVGTACDDNDPGTGNDVYNADCVCAGELIDCLGVPGGSATIGSQCNDNNPATGDDVYNADCVCIGELIDCEGVPGGSATIGSQCNDNNPATGNDVYNADCVCAGELIDCLGVPGGSATIGSQCNDNNPATGNDVYNANCVCAGELIDCLGVPGGSATIGSQCNDNNPATGDDVYNADCVCIGELIDCAGVPGGSATIGSQCNDNNPATGNDVYNADCVCAGQVIDCLGVAGGNALPGTACNDNNPATGNDTWNADCVCAGELIDCNGVAGGTALPDTACTTADGSAGVWSAECICVGNVGITEHPGDGSLVLFPNPASTVLYISTASGRLLHVKVYDLIGNLVLRHASTNTLALEHLAPGSYVVVAYDPSSGHTFYARFVKQ